MIIDKPAAVTCTCLAFFWVGAVFITRNDVPKPLPTEAEVAQEVAKDAYTAALKDSDRYNRAYSSCMQERPGSEDRADCLWDAQQDYPQGYRLHLQQQILERTGYNVDLGIPNPY